MRMNIYKFSSVLVAFVIAGIVLFAVSQQIRYRDKARAIKITSMKTISEFSDRMNSQLRAKIAKEVSAGWYSVEPCDCEGKAQSIEHCNEVMRLFPCVCKADIDEIAKTGKSTLGDSSRTRATRVCDVCDCDYDFIVGRLGINLNYIHCHRSGVDWRQSPINYGFSRIGEKYNGGDPIGEWVAHVSTGGPNETAVIDGDGNVICYETWQKDMTRCMIVFSPEHEVIGMYRLMPPILRPLDKIRRWWDRGPFRRNGRI